ncbi:MAG TPA: hypothetical protein VF939_18585 [Puia sp.]
MKAKVNTKKLVKVPKSGLLSLVAAKLKDRDLFPEKNEEAKNYLKKAKISAS